MGERLDRVIGKDFLEEKSFEPKPPVEYHESWEDQAKRIPERTINKPKGLTFEMSLLWSRNIYKARVHGGSE